MILDSRTLSCTLTRGRGFVSEVGFINRPFMQIAARVFSRLAASDLHCFHNQEPSKLNRAESVYETANRLMMMRMKAMRSMNSQLYTGLNYIL